MGSGRRSAHLQELPAEQQGMLRARLEALMRPNTFDPQTKTITVPAVRAEAMGKVADHYVSLFGNAPETAELREAYAMKNNTVPDEAHRRALTGFFWWTAWGAGTERPASSGRPSRLTRSG